MDEKTFKIWFEEIGDIPAGWWAGHSRINDAIYDRSEEECDANLVDDINAVSFAMDFIEYGYPCKIVPKILAKRKLEILGLEGC